MDQQFIHEDNYGQDNVDISQIEAPEHHEIEEHPGNLYEPVKKYPGPVVQIKESHTLTAAPCHSPLQFSPFHRE